MEFFNKWSVIFVERLMKDFEISLLSSIAIVGNAGQESGGFKSLQEKKPVVKGSRGGYGIMQWTGPRRVAYESYCERNNLDPADMESNYKFLFVELKGEEGRVLPRLEAAQSLEQKVEVFMKGFLRPGIPHLQSRVEWARRVQKAWDKAHPEHMPETTPPPVTVPPKTEEKTEDEGSGLLGVLKVILKALGWIK